MNLEANSVGILDLGVSSENLNNNPRIIVVQKLYSHFLNKESELIFPKHRYKKFIKDVVIGTIERKDLIQDLIDEKLKEDINQNKTDLMLAASLSKAYYFQAYYVESDLSKRDTLYLKGAESALRGFENSTFYQSFSDTSKFENNNI